MSSVLMRGVLLCYLITIKLAAQPHPEAEKQKTAASATSQGQKSARLTPLQQEGLKTLQAAEAEAKALPAPMRAYLLLEIGSRDKPCQRAKLVSLFGRVISGSDLQQQVGPHGSW